MKFNIEVKAGDDKGNKTKFDHTIIKVNYNRCDMRKGGTYFHRIFHDIFNSISNGGSKCPIKKGNYSLFSEINESFLPPVPKIILPSGVMRTFLKIFQKGCPVNDKKFYHIASFEIVAIYEK